MEFEDRDAFEAWLKGQPREVCVAIAARAAVRVWPLVLAKDRWSDDAAQSEVVLRSGSAIMTASVSVQVPTDEVFERVNAYFAFAGNPATLAARAADSVVAHAVDACHAAVIATYAADGTKADVLAHSAAIYAASGPRPAKVGNLMTAVVYRDADFDAESMFQQDLWHGQGWPEELDPAKLGPSLLDDADFAFLRRWFFAMAKGEPLPIDLMTRIALEIDQDVWDSGDPKAVAAAIAKIEDEWTAEQAAKAGRAPEYEPKDVSRLFAYPQSVIASVSHTSQTITQNFVTFRQETGLNQTPEYLNALEAIPASLDRIGGILAHQAQSAASKQALREEIGRLKARVAQLEADLAAVKCAPEVKEKPWFKEVKILGPAVGAMLSAMGVVYWHVSDDETGFRQRNENIARQWGELWGEAEPKQSERQVQGARIADKR